MLRFVAASLVLASALVACGDGGTSTTLGATTQPGSPPVCQPLADVVRLSTEFDGRIDDLVTRMAETAGDSEGEALALGEFATLISETEPVVAELLEKYDEAAALADGDLRGDIEAVRETTAVVWPILVQALENAETFAEFGDAYTAGLQDPSVAPLALAGGAGALGIDEFSVPNCGFQVSNA